MPVTYTTPYDEAFVTYTLAIPSVASLIATRMYHMEVFQKVDNLASYPCIVYLLTDDDPEQELAENSGMLTATYNLTIIAKNSSDLRTLAEAIKNWYNDITNLDSIYCDTKGLIPWIAVYSDTEENEFAIEQQVKGLQTTSLQVAIDHWQPTAL